MDSPVQAHFALAGGSYVHVSASRRLTRRGCCASLRTCNGIEPDNVERRFDVLGRSYIDYDTCAGNVRPSLFLRLYVVVIASTPGAWVVLRAAWCDAAGSAVERRDAVIESFPGRGEFR